MNRAIAEEVAQYGHYRQSDNPAVSIDKHERIDRPTMSSLLEMPQKISLDMRLCM
jgi:hypothetical protein